MKKMIPLIAMTAVSIPAIAAETDAFYGAVGSGAYRFESEGFDERAATLSLLGGYRLNEHVAFEADYTRLFEANGNVDGIDIELDGNVWDLSTKLSVPVGDRFSPYGRLGWSYLDLSAVGTSNGTSVRANDYDDGFLWAIGTGYKLNRKFSLNGEYSKVLISDADFDRLSLNLSYQFGSQ